MTIKEEANVSRLNVPLPGWTPLPQVVARRLQQMILDGELREGDQIPSQRVLSEQFNVSRASLREALLTLETLGLIKTQPGRGTFVTAGRPDSGAEIKWRYSDSFPMQDVFETRQMLEGQIAETAARNVDAATLAALRDATDEMERCWGEGDLLSNVEADLRFHRTIALACRNQMLQSLYETVQSLLTETQRQPIPRTNPTRMRASLAEHREIIAALSRADGRAARDAMERHVRNTAECAGILLPKV
ncbi:FadR/GntR family transcriptional regulator [Tabrizicola sp. BL-A-41-H6]|uniref:FadR/GntR family transcriptional regulator n=1 Tax=Tabrizicola sp. BL-A-41-H6 TaxID=3421107 RepID=UPI003D67E07D